MNILGNLNVEVNDLQNYILSGDVTEDIFLAEKEKGTVHESPGH